MITHIAIFRWKKGVQQDAIENTMRNIKRLKKECKGIIDIICGENFSQYSKGFTHAIVVLAKDRKALESYRKHQAHLGAARIIEQMEDDGIGIDFEDK